MVRWLFKSAGERMPASDYVSIVRSVYKDQKAMLFGAMAGAVAASLAAQKTGSWLLLGIAGCILLSGAFRYVIMRAFWAENIADDDVAAASRWEFWATVGGALVVTTYGVWCFVSIVFVDDAFAEMTSASLSLAAMSGVVARNFGLSRLVNLQTGLLSVLFGAGLFFSGDPYYLAFATLLIIMIVSFSKLAGDTRAILLNAVHGRADATRLAVELDTALATMSHGLCMTDASGCITVVNDAILHDFLGTTNEDFIGRPIAELVNSAFNSGVISRGTADYLIGELRAGGQQKLVIGLADGRQCEVTVTTRGGFSVLLVEDITERVRAHERISFMARYDGLTGLSNRTFFSEQVEERLTAMAASGSSEPVSLMIVDIDDFKHVNDTFGHVAGDQLLVEVAERIREVIAPDTLIGRFGGDEFTLFRYSHVSADTANEEAQAILGLLRVPFRLRSETIVVNCSIGVVIAGGADTDVETLFTRSDLALYAAKGRGKAQSCIFHDQMDVEYRQRQRLKQDLQEALDQDQLLLHYQPIIELKTRRIVGCEALVRWRHPELGMIPPMNFISIAEETGMISEITRFVLHTACHECARWPAHMGVSVNLSANDFRAVQVEDMVMEALAASGLAPERLTVEITESILIEEMDKAAEALKALRANGIGVALDDFGTGYSSLSYLDSMPFSKLKIDRAFVVDVVSSKRARRLLANIVRLSTDLDMTVTIEGVETEEQLEAITRTTEVQYAQGYLFGRPLPARDMAELVARVAGSPPDRTSRPGAVNE